MAECLTMSVQKTGALLGAACQLGALAGGADDRDVACYREFGRKLGLAYQFVDDLLGIWGDPGITGKPAGADLASRKKSLPVVWALNSETRAGEELRQLYARKAAFDPCTIIRTADLVEATGARDWARQQADVHLDTALRCLTAAVTGESARDLRTLAAFITGRDH